MKTRARKKWGYSLVEFMMGSSVATVVLAGTFSAVGQARLMSNNVKSDSAVTQVLQTEMEQLRTLRWKELEKLPRNGKFTPEEHFSNFPFKHYSCRRSITSRRDDQKEVRLIFSWSPTEQGKKTKSRELVSFFTKNGLYDFNYRAL